MFTHSRDACCRDSTQASVHGADIGSFLCCSGDNVARTLHTMRHLKIEIALSLLHGA